MVRLLSSWILICYSLCWSDLYKGGLQRDLFLPFIAELKHRCKVHYINSETDYRLIGERAGHVYIEGSIKEPGTSAALQDVWDRLTEHRPGESAELNIRGRKLFVPQTTKGIALFQFSDLCEKALGPADFTLIAQTFHTVLIDKIPKLSLSQANEVRRFITLIDELYEHHVKLICTAEVPAQELFLSKLDKNSADHVSAEEEIFAFSRTVSRLMEMQTSDYLQSKHTPHPHQRHGHRKDKDPSHQQ
jgi:predicted ATPase